MSTLPKPEMQQSNHQRIHIRLDEKDKERLTLIQKHLRDQGLTGYSTSRNTGLRYALQVTADLIEKER